MKTHELMLKAADILDKVSRGMGTLDVIELGKDEVSVALKKRAKKLKKKYERKIAGGA